MKKLSRLMLLGVPFLAFSGVSFGDDSNTDNSKNIQIFKIKSKYSYYLKSDDQSLIPTDSTGSQVVLTKTTIHISTIYDDKGKPIHEMTWIKEGKTPIILSSNPVTADTNTNKDKDAPPKTDVTINSDQGIDVVVHDDAPNGDKPANKEETVASQPPAIEKAAPSTGSDPSNPTK